MERGWRGKAGIMWADLYYRWWVAFAAMVLSQFLLGIPVAVSAENTGSFDFAHRVAPILKNHCVECHGGRQHKGDFSINTRESFLENGDVLAGNAMGSHLVELLSSADKDERMPKNKPPLSQDEIDTLRAWI